MSELQPFDPEPTCPKCASGDIRDKHVGAKTEHNIFGPHPEHLERHCNDCGYWWHSQTADAETP